MCVRQRLHLRRRLSSLNKAKRSLKASHHWFQELPALVLICVLPMEIGNTRQGQLLLRANKVSKVNRASKVAPPTKGEASRLALMVVSGPVSLLGLVLLLVVREVTKESAALVLAGRKVRVATGLEEELPAALARVLLRL